MVFPSYYQGIRSFKTGKYHSQNMNPGFLTLSSSQIYLMIDLMLSPLYHNTMIGDVLEWPFHYAWLDTQKMWLSPGNCHVRALRWEFQWQRWARTRHCTIFPAARLLWRLCDIALGQGAGGSAPSELHFWASLSSRLDLSEYVVKWNKNNNNDKDKNNT